VLNVNDRAAVVDGGSHRTWSSGEGKGARGGHQFEARRRGKVAHRCGVAAAAPRQIAVREERSGGRKADNRQLRSEKEGWSALVSLESRGEWNLVKGVHDGFCYRSREKNWGGDMGARREDGQEGGSDTQPQPGRGGGG
jgi:hypothetical protein